MSTRHRLKLSDDAPLLTLAYYKQLQAEQEADTRLIAELPARIAKRKKLLEAAKLFIPLGSDGGELRAAAKKKPVLVIPKRRKQFTLQLKSKNTGGKNTTWGKELLRIAKENRRGMTNRELLEEAAKTSLGKSRSKGDKGFYNALARLVKGGELVKHEGFVYADKVFQKLKANGEPLPVNPSYRAGTTPGLVAEVLGAHPDGLAAGDLQEIVAKRPEAPDSIRKHRHYIYNILNSLIESKAVEKEDGVYRLVSQ